MLTTYTEEKSKNNLEDKSKTRGCRGCVRGEGCAPLSPSWSLLARRFNELTSIRISDDDGLPMFLCRECLAVLNKAHQFKEQCLRSDTFFRSQIKIDNEENENSSKFIATDDPIENADDDNALKDVKTDADDDFYLIVVNESSAIETESVDNALTKKDIEINDEDVNCIISDGINSHISENTQELLGENISFENNKMKNDFSEIDYSLRVENSDSISNVHFDLIPLLKDNSEVVNNSIIKLEECSTSLIKPFPLEFAEEDSYTQEVIVTNGEETYEIVDYNISELNVNSSTKQNNTSAVTQKSGCFTCKCGESFFDLTVYQKHVAGHNKHTCNVCGKAFDSKQVMKGHMLLHESFDSHLQCPYCNKVIRRNLLTLHINTNHGPNRPTCSICHKTFSTEHNRKRHMLIHLDSKDYECDICHITFNHKIAMQNHRLLHEKLYELRCQDCFEEFTTESELKQHLEEGCQPSSDKKDTDKHICSKCGKTYSSQFSLQTHIEFVHGFEHNVLLCAECGEVFSDKKAMFAHSHAHRLNRKNDKKLYCKVCGKVCPNNAVLLIHERVHTNERPFNCNKCSLSFKTRSHLMTHQLTHTQEKRFGCSVCMKFFSLKGNLIVHLRTHTGERPYVCNICSQAFIDSKYLKKHKLRRHGDSAW